MASEMPRPETISSPTADTFVAPHSRTSSVDSNTSDLDESSVARTSMPIASDITTTVLTAPNSPTGEQQAVAGFSYTPLPSPLGTLQQQRKRRQNQQDNRLRRATQSAALPQYHQTKQQHPTQQQQQYHNHHDNQSQQCQSQARTQRRAHPSLHPTVTRLRYPLAPLHPLPTGSPHPSFPPTLLTYHLLTEPQLDSLARYYHQLTSPTTAPCIWTYGYPTTMEHYDLEFLQFLGEEKGVEARARAKRRMWGKFIGLRGCERLQGGEEEVVWERWVRRREEARGKDWAERGWVGRF